MDYAEFGTYFGGPDVALEVRHDPCGTVVHRSNQFEINLAEIWTACEEHTCPET